MRWEIQVEAYLTGAADHIRVICHTKGNDGKYTDPVTPTDAEERKSWEKSEHVAQGIIMATASDLHLELIHKLREGSIWKMWSEIKSQHEQHDASLWHKVWMQLFMICKKPAETYMDLY